MAARQGSAFAAPVPQDQEHVIRVLLAASADTGGGRASAPRRSSRRSPWRRWPPICRRSSSVTHAGDDRLFLTLRDGRILVFTRAAGCSARPLLDIARAVTQRRRARAAELAFHPAYATNGRFFVNYTDRSGDTVIARYQVGADPDRADPAASASCSRIDQPFANHNGGQLAVRPRRLPLHRHGRRRRRQRSRRAARRDGGTLLGKMLRIDVDQTRRDAVLRHPADNPFVGTRRARRTRSGPTGCATRGASPSTARPATSTSATSARTRARRSTSSRPASAGGENYGWTRDGGHALLRQLRLPGGGAACGDPALTRPVLEYDRTTARLLGHRRLRLPRLAPCRGSRGAYFFGDFCSGRLWGAVPTAVVAGGQSRSSRPLPGLTSFGEDAAGELYLVSNRGALVRLTSGV